MARSGFRNLPGFPAAISFTVAYLAVLLLIPLAALMFKATSLSPAEFLKAALSPRALAAYRLTFVASTVAAALSVAVGLLLAWVLVRYEFFGRRFLDSLIDLPFALPTAVAGLIFSGLFVKNGLYGQYLVPLGIKVAYTPLGIILVLVFVGFPFAVRTIQPVLESFDHDVEEAAALMGANRWQTIRWVIFPALRPSLLTSFALSFARGVGEYGSVVFISANKQMESEIAPVLVVSLLEGFALSEATAVAVVLLIISVSSLCLINWLEQRGNRHAR